MSRAHSPPGPSITSEMMILFLVPLLSEWVTLTKWSSCLWREPVSLGVRPIGVVETLCQAYNPDSTVMQLSSHKGCSEPQPLQKPSLEQQNSHFLFSQQAMLSRPSVWLAVPLNESSSVASSPALLLMLQVHINALTNCSFSTQWSLIATILSH